MKSKIILLFLLISSFIGFSQPVINRTFGTNTVNDPRLSATLNLLIPRYGDTTAANSGTNLGVDSCSAIIFTYSDNSYWLRACNPKRWIKILKTGDVASSLANNGLSKNGDTVQFGQTVNAVGNPAALNNSREIPLNGYNIGFSGTGTIGIGTAAPATTSKLAIIASGTTRGINITSATGTGINISSTNQGIEAQVSGATSTAIAGSTTGGAGSYGIQGSGGIGGTGGRFYTIAAGSDASPVALELERLPTGGGVTNGAGFTVMFRNSFTNGTSGNESGRITNYFSNAVSGTQTSAFGFHLMNNAVSARKALLAGDGQWTWDGYPALTAQVDTTTYKPVAIDGSGNVVKMSGWPGSGGTFATNNIGTGFAWVATPSGNIKRVANGYGMLWDSTSTANSLTAKADTSTLKAVYLPLNANANKTINQNGFNYYFTGSGQFQADSVKYTELEAPPAVTDMIMLGNSIAFGQGASIADSSLKNKLANYYGLTLVDLSLSGSGVWRAASNFYLNVNPGHNNLTVIMAGLNDVRRNAYAAKTHNKIVNAYQGVFINQYMDTWVTATDASVTKIGSWSSGYTSSTVGGKGVNGGILSTTAGDTARWDFTGTSVAVGLMGADGVGGSSYEYANGKIYIDDVFIMNFNEDSQWDGVSDGVNDNKRGTYPFFFTGLSAGSHNIKIVQDDPGVFLVIDYFATLVEPSDGKPLILVHAPYLNNAGYAASPNLANNSIIDSLNNLIDSMYTVFTAAGYPVYLSQIENCYDTLTGLSGDNIHPNDVGYQQMFVCTKMAAPSFGTPATKGTVYYANDGFFYGSRDGVPKRLAYVGDTASYILNRTSIAQTAGFKINGTGTAGNFVSSTAAFGNVSLSSATGVLLSMTPVAGQSLVTITGSVTGSVITNNTNASATSGFLWVQRNVSSSTSAYSAMALAVQGSGDATGSPQFGFRNDGISREYIIGMDVSNSRFEINWGNQAQLNGRHLFALDSNGVVHLRTPPAGAITDSILVYRASDTSVRMINASSIGAATTIYNGDGAISGNRLLTRGANTLTFTGTGLFEISGNHVLNLGTGGSPLLSINVTSSGRVALFSGITYGTDADNTDADYTVAANTIIAEVSDILTSDRTLTLPTASINGQTVTLLMRFSTDLDTYSLSAAVTDNATGLTFTQLDWGKTYDFMVDQGLQWRLIRKY
jgi:hypothetical protein